jgi:hypothetical protein
VILDLAANGVDPTLVKTISDSVAVVLTNAKIVDDVTSAADMRAMLGIEGEKRAAGCESQDQCMSEVAQALGAEVLVHGSVGRFGAVYAVTLNLFDAKSNRAIAREQVDSEKLELLQKKVDAASRRLALAYQGKPVEAVAIPEDSAGASMPMLVAGAGLGVLGAAGVVVGAVLAGSAGSTLSDPLSSGANKASAETTQPVYVAAAAAGGVVAAAGAGLVAAAFLMP